MIDVIEVIGPDGTLIPGVTVPPEIAACGPGAPVYLVIDPSQGTPLTRAQVEEEVRRNYKRGASIIFPGTTRCPMDALSM